MTPGVRYPLADGRSVVYFTAPLPHLRLFRDSTRVGSIWGPSARLEEWFNVHAPSIATKGKPMKGKLLSLLFGSALSFVAFAACTPDHVFASGFDRATSMPAQIHEFTVFWPLHIETVTCDTWAQTWDSDQSGVFTGEACKVTGDVPNRTGSAGGAVSATFATGDGTIELADCRLAGVAGSGGSGGAIVTYLLDCT